jgi:hypothetical protein
MLTRTFVRQLLQEKMSKISIPHYDILLCKPRFQGCREVVLCTENDEKAKVQQAHKHLRVSDAFSARRKLTPVLRPRLDSGIIEHNLAN